MSFPPRAVALLLVLSFLPACHAPPEDGEERRASRPWIVVGIDGGEWSVVRELWDEGRLPHLLAIAERGVTAELRTRYTASPVIWTTVATGVRPEEHGITGFVVPTAAGDVPVSSTVRRVPAIWNMATRAQRRVAVLGWWASWPAEDVRGVVVSDRAWLDLDRRVSPPEFLERFLAEDAVAAKTVRGFGGGNEATRVRDRGVAHLAPLLAAEGYDLLLVYFRGVDIASHNHWRHYRPQDFADPADPADVAAFGGRIPGEYEAVDEAIGRIVAAAGGGANVLVVSDHGFEAAKKEIVKVALDFDRVLERLGYLTRDVGGGVDVEASLLSTHASPELRAAKRVRFGATVPGEERTALRERFERDLARVRFGNGEAAFKVRDPRPGERAADFVARTRVAYATKELLLDGDPAPFAGLVGEIHRISGTHGGDTHGIFLAAGPDVDPGAGVDGISIHDVTPTLLYGLHLPVGENFAGRAWTELFSESFRRRHPLRTIAAWELPRDGEVTTSEADAEMVRELRALGYLD